jgi:hypothetical protein
MAAREGTGTYLPVLASSCSSTEKRCKQPSRVKNGVMVRIGSWSSPVGTTTTTTTITAAAAFRNPVIGGKCLAPRFLGAIVR